MPYYYLVASLPAVSLDTKPPISRDDFLRSCQGVLSASDFREVTLVLENRESEATHPNLRRWRDRETQLRNALAKWRAAKSSIDPTQFQKPHNGFDVALEHGVADAMSRANPLEREQALDNLRWRIADDLALEAPFGMPAIFSFLIKLRLAERRHGWNDDNARQAFEALLEKIMQETNHG